MPTSSDIDKYLAEKTGSISNTDPTSISSTPTSSDIDKYLAEKTGSQPPNNSGQLSNLLANIQSGVHTAGNAARGLLQGATYGGSDELTGGVRAGINQLLNPSSDIVKKYQDYRDLERKANTQAEQENPKLYKAAELAGSFLPTLAFPEASLAGPITEGMSVAQKIGQGGLLGAEAGAKMGLGQSTADLTKGDIGGAAADTAAGAAGGALAGGVLQGGVEAVKGVGGAVGKGLMSLANKYKPTQIIANSTQKGIQGVDLTDLGAHREALGNTAEDVAQAALSQEGNLQNQPGGYKDIINKAKESGQTTHMSDYMEYLQDLQNRYKGLRDPEAQKEIQNTVDMVKGVVEPGETDVGTGVDTDNLFNLQKKLGQQANSPDSTLTTPAGREFAKAADKQLSGIANDSIEGLRELNSKYSGLKTAMDLLGLDSYDSLVKNMKTGELELAPKTLGKIQSYVQASTNDSMSRNKAEQAINLVMDNLKAAGVDTTNLRKQVTEASQNFELAKDIAGKGIHARLPVANVKNIAWMGNLIGQQVGKGTTGDTSGLIQGLSTYTEPKTSNYIRSFIPAQHSASVDNNVQTGKSVYDASNDELSKVSQRLKASGMPEKAESLQNALDSNDTQKKNALVFSLMQNPSTRGLFTEPTEVPTGSPSGAAENRRF